MERKLFIFILILVFSATTSEADERRRVELNDDHPKEMVQLSYCNIFVSKGDTDDNGYTKVSVEIENLDETNIIVLFGHGYPEKELKKLSPSITFDKKFPGTKGQRLIDTYKDIQNVSFIEPSEKCLLPQIQVKETELYTCRLPLYFSKYKIKSILGLYSKKTKLLLMEKEILELEIEVTPDKDFTIWKDEYNALIDEISKQIFCTNPKHKPVLEKQEEPYKDRIKKAVFEIDSTMALHAWPISYKIHQRYSELKKKFNTIDFSKYEGDCGNRHGGNKVTKVGCKYCSLSPQQVYEKLNSYYIRIYNGTTQKSKVMADVELLYSCRKHSQAWRSSIYTKRIVERYNQIRDF